MNLKNTLRLSIISIMCQKARFCLSIILIGMSLLGIGYFLLFSNESKWDRDECDRVLARGIEETGAMQVWNPGSYEARKLKEEAIASGMVECIGTWTSGDMRWILSRDLVIGQKGQRPRIGWIAIDRTALGICELRFAQKLEVPEEKWKDPSWRGIYLGWKYHDVIPLGTVYVDEVRFQMPVEYEVIGILEKGQEFISDTVIANGEGNGVFSVENWDDVVIEPMEPYVSDGYAASNWAYTPGEGVSLKEAQAYLEEKASELGLDVDFANLSEGFYAEELKWRDRRRIEKEICVMLCITCLLINACILLIQLIGDKKEIGIFHACGFSCKDVISIYAWQSVLKVLIAFAMAWVGLKRYGQLHFEVLDVPARQLTLWHRWLNHIALPYMACFGMALIGILILIQIGMTWRSVPAELMKDSRG